MAAVKTKARVMVGLGRSIGIFWLGHTHFVWPIAVEMTAVQRGSVILTRWVREAVTWLGNVLSTLKP